jgi:hypothetical protein
MTLFDEEMTASIFTVEVQADQAVSKQNIFLEVKRSIVR